MSRHSDTNSASKIAHYPVACRRTKTRRGEVIGEQVISSHLVRHGTNHPSRRRHVTLNAITNDHSVAALLMTSCEIGLNPPGLINSTLRTRPLWISNNSPPGPLSHERGGGRCRIQCIFHTYGCMHAGYMEPTLCHPRNGPVRALVGTLSLTL